MSKMIGERYPPTTPLTIIDNQTPPVGQILTQISFIMNKQLLKIVLLRAQIDGVLERVRRHHALAQAYVTDHDNAVEQIGAYVAGERASGKCAACDANNNCIMQEIAADRLIVSKYPSLFGFVRQLARIDEYVTKQAELGRPADEIWQDVELNTMLINAGVDSDILR